MERFASQARGRRMLTSVEWAERNLVLPEGPFVNQHWRPSMQPYTAAALELMDRAPLRWFRFSGCVQSGKSLLGLIRCIWHLAERGEDVGYAVPDIDQSGRDKWQKEFLPVFEASPALRVLLPLRGEGSKGGTPTSIRLRNGANLRFISGTGGDHHRSNFTLPVTFCTEVDRYDTAGNVSRETSPPEQIINRTLAYGMNGWTYEECTVTDETGRIWVQYQESTRHKFYVPCVHCREAVCPDRGDLVGYDDAPDIVAAGLAGHFRCPKCEAPYTEDERQSMLLRMFPAAEGELIHYDATGVPVISGAAPVSNRIGFIWNAFHNAFWTTEQIARDEWSALYSAKPTEMDLQRRQHAWTIPAEPSVFTLTPLTIQSIVDRVKTLDKSVLTTMPLGVAPPNTVGVCAQVDVGKHLLHFVVRALYLDGDKLNLRIIDLGSVEVRSKEIGFRKALREAVFTLDDRFAKGYREHDGKLTHPVMLRGIDGGWQGDEVGVSKEMAVWETLIDLEVDGRGGWVMTLGRGQSEAPGKGSYVHPKKLSDDVLEIGDQWHIRRSTKVAEHYAAAEIGHEPFYAIVNSDVWKNFIREGYDIPVGQEGAVLAFNAFTKEERDLLREYTSHIIAEKRKRKPVPRRGTVVVFENERERPNHLGDADYGACVMFSLAKLPVSLQPAPRPPETEEKLSPIVGPNGRPFLVTQR
jgi:hypothetical protein